MKKLLALFFIAAIVITIGVGVVQVKSAFAIPFCQDICKYNGICYPSSAQCWCPGGQFSTTCAGYCNSLCD